MNDVLMLRKTDTSVEELVDRLDMVVNGAMTAINGEYSRVAEAARVEGVTLGGDVNEARGAIFASAHFMLGIVEDLRTELEATRDIIREQQGLISAYQQHSLTDPLTGLFNRRGLENELQRRLSAVRRHKQPLSLLFIDIDHFKRTNDNFGHEAGDKVLCSVANVMRCALRDTDCIARYGGEEFVAILPDTRTLNACRAAERIRSAVANSLIAYGNSEIAATVSIGVADCDPSSENLLPRADSALYAAKDAGRNRVYVEMSGSHRPLRPHPNTTSERQQRRFLRFRVEGIHIKLRLPQQPWHEADVVDESLTGLGVRAASNLKLGPGALVEVDYCGELGTAVVIHTAVESDATYLGLHWVDNDLS